MNLTSQTLKFGIGSGQVMCF